MEVVIKTAFSPGDRVWMPDGFGGKTKGRVTRVTLYMADLTAETQKIEANNLNYECENIKGEKHWFHEYQLKFRGKAE